MKNLKVTPATEAIHKAYNPLDHSGAIKMPLYQSSSYAFQSAQQGKHFFEKAYGLNETEFSEPGWIYGRIGHPNAAILEERARTWDHAEEAAVFQSGMAGITTVFLTFLKPGDTLLYGAPSYGGTEHFVRNILLEMGIRVVSFSPEESLRDVSTKLASEHAISKVDMVFIESPANPTCQLFDIVMCKQMADILGNPGETPLVVDNTFMGPLWCQPLKHGADLVVYSATKYIGGHSDLIAGLVMGNQVWMGRVKEYRGLLGNIATPHTCWLLLRSLETLEIRMDKQAQNARSIAEFLDGHAMVEKVYYPGLLRPGDEGYALLHRQYSSPGAMISFEIKGNQENAFKFLDALELFKLAVSLGSTESLAQHPSTMTHAGMKGEDKEALGITESLIRLSIGIESAEDLILDLNCALQSASKHPPYASGSEKVKTDEKLPEFSLT